MNKISKLSLVLIITLFSVSIFAQKKRDFFTMVKGDSLAIFVTQPLSANEMFDVYRKTDSGMVKLNREPVRPILDVGEAQLILGRDWQLIEKAVDSENDVEVLQQIRSKTFRGALLSLISNGAAKVSGRWFVDNDIKVGNSYTYKLLFSKSSGKVIDSLQKTVKAEQITPIAPSNLKLTAGDKQIHLEWDYPNWKGDFTDLGFRYKIYRKMKNGKFVQVNKDVVIRDDNTTPHYDDLWLEDGKKYSYKVTIVDPIGNESKPSNVAELFLVDKTPPSIVTNVFSEPKENGLVISWNMSPQIDAKGYNIYRARSLKGTFKKLNKSLIPVDKPFYIDSTLVDKTQFFYTVSAVDTAGNEGKKSNPNATYLKDKFPPDAPTNFAYKLDKDNVRFTWKKAKAKDLDGYNIYRSERKTGRKARLNKTPIKEAKFFDKGEDGTGFGYGAKLYYSITAQDSSGNESDSVNIIVYVPDSTPPNLPRNFTVKSKGDYININCGMSSSRDADKYILYKSELKSKKNKIAEFDTAPFNFADTSIKKGVSYIYEISVIDTAGNVSVTTLADTVKFVDFTPPPSPRNLKARINGKSVELTWVKSVDYDLVGYNIYRSDYPTGKFQKLNKNVLIDTRYTDKSGTINNFYRVRAIDSSGNESKYDKTVSPK